MVGDRVGKSVGTEKVGNMDGVLVGVETDGNMDGDVVGVDVVGLVVGLKVGAVVMHTLSPSHVRSIIRFSNSTVRVQELRMAPALLRGTQRLHESGQQWLALGIPQIVLQTVGVNPSSSSHTVPFSQVPM